MNKHTATPWKIVNGTSEFLGVNHKDYTFKTIGDDMEAKANAEFIVGACNSHDALVEALEKAYYLLYNSGDRLTSTGIRDNEIVGESIAKILPEISRALKLAKGE